MPKAIIIGAGPDGLAAARNVLQQRIWPIILEPSGSLRGLAGPAQWSSDAYITLLGEVNFHQLVQHIYFVRDELCSLHTVNNVTDELTLFRADCFFLFFLLPFLENRSFRNLAGSLRQ